MRVISKRGFAAAACPRPLGQPANVECTTLPNKAVVASAESTLPLTRVSVAFRAGSRNETYDSLGAAFLLRNAAGMSTQCSTGFAICRNIEQAGGKLYATADRELVTYTVDTTADQSEVALRYLQDIIQPAFKPWELSDDVPHIKSQVSAVTSQQRAIELLHKAAFRNGLGNSVIIPKFKIGKLSSETMQHYFSNNCTAARCAIVGVGIDHNTLTGFAQSLDLSTGGGNTAAAKYYGGDCRKDRAGNYAYVAVAGVGGGLKDQKEALAFAVLQNAWGKGAGIKYGSINGALGKAFSGAVSGSAQFSTLNLNYEDTGLFGFTLAADSESICKGIDAVVKALKSGQVSDADVKRGKALLKSSVLESYSSDRKLLGVLSKQAGITRKIDQANDVIAAIDAISTADVQAAAKKAGSSKLSIGAIGNLGNVPYSTDL